MSPIKAIFILAVLTTTANSVTIYAAGVKSNNECEFALKPLQDILATAPPFPQDWRIIVACTDGLWNDVLVHYDALEISQYAITIQKLRLTIIRGRVFQDLCITSRQRLVVLHELGHIALKTDDEDRANRFAKEHMRPARLETLAQK